MYVGKWDCALIANLCLIAAVAEELPWPTEWFPLDPVVGRVEPASDEALSDRLRGKSVLVVGGTDGIGRGTATAMARAGSSVAIVGHSSRKARAVLGNMSAVATRPQEQHFQAYVVDLFTVRGTLDFLEQLKGNKTRFDYVVLTVGVWPDWKDPHTADGVDKVVALDVVARFLIVREIIPLLNPGARVLSALASSWRLIFWRDITTIEASDMKKIMMGTRKYSLPEMLGTAATAADTWMQGMSMRHPGVGFVGTFPGIVATDLVDHGTFPKWLEPYVDRGMRAVGMPIETCGRLHAAIITSPNAVARPVTYFSVEQPMCAVVTGCTAKLEGRLTNGLAYDAEFGRWVWSFLEETVANHTTAAAPLMV